jgi:NAD(P)-dependent dehydrogenase (short-subunit alcohol dehydrogenase family)
MEMLDVVECRVQRGFQRPDLGCHPARRLTTPREIADVIVFVAFDRASFLTGATVAADAGRTAI